MTHSSIRPAVSRPPQQPRTMAPMRAELRARIGVGVASLALLAFGAWAAWVGLAVRDLRVRLEQNVRWLSEVHAAESVAQGALADDLDAEAAREAIASLRAELSSMGEAGVELASVEASLDALDGALSARAVGRHAAADALGDELSALTLRLRARAAGISTELASRWTDIERALGGAIGLALLTIALLLSSLRAMRRQRETSEQLADAQAAVAEAERLSSIGRTLAQLGSEISAPLDAVVNNVAPMRGYLRSLDDVLTRYRELLIARNARDEAAQIAAEAELALVLSDFPEAISAVEHAADGVRGVLADLSRFAKGDEPSRSMVDLGAVATATVAMLKRSVPRGVHVELALEPAQRVPAISAAVGQLAHALVRYAVGALGGEGRLRVWVRDVGDGAEIGVEHDGPEVAEEQLVRLLDPGASDTTLAAGKLALLLARHVTVERHGGYFELLPREGGGVRVAAALPSSPRGRDGTGPVVPAALRVATG